MLYRFGGIAIVLVLYALAAYIRPQEPSYFTTMTAEEEAADLAQVMMSNGPVDLGQGAHMFVKAEGKTLTITQVGVKTYGDVGDFTTDTRAERMVETMFCQRAEARQFTAKGGKIRIETINEVGKHLDPLIIDRCSE